MPADVAFRRVPAVFSSSWETLGKFYYALEQVGNVDAMSKKVFAAIHVQRMRFDKESDILAFVKQHGVDEAKFTDAYRSFAVATKIRQAKQLAEAYRIDGVPTVGIHGRWFTAPSLHQGDGAKTLAVVDSLIARARKGA